MADVGVHACTDVSGFGLLGHLGEMLDAGAVAADVNVEAVPLHPGVLDLIAHSVYAGGLRSNRDFLLPRLRTVGEAGAEARDAGRASTGSGADGPFAGPPAAQDPRVLALFDPQTSGGLLVAVAAERHRALLAALDARVVPSSTEVRHRAIPATSPCASDMARPSTTARPRRESRAQARRPRVEAQRGRHRGRATSPGRTDPARCLRDPVRRVGVIGVLALVAWAAVFVFGVGTSNGAVWRGRRAGLPARSSLQVAVMLLLGVACTGVAGLAIFATGYGVKPRQPWCFWPRHRRCSGSSSSFSS